MLYIKLKLSIEQKDLSVRLWGITTEFVGFVPQSFMLRSINMAVLG